MSQRGAQSGHRPGAAAAGFTIIELLVALAILMLMLMLIDRLFFETSRAISQGVALTNVVHSSNVISDQLTRDSEAMLGPGTPTGGVLIILNSQVQAPRLTDSPYYPETGTASPPWIRSDQLIFIGGNLSGVLIQPICPQSPDDLWNDTTASAVRLWYGHVRRTNAQGTDVGAGDLGQSGPNRLAVNWTLGRQALLLTESVDSNANGLIRSDANTGSPAVRNLDGAYNTPVQGYGSSGSNGYPASIAADTGGLALYKGLTDVAAWDLGPDSNTSGAPKNTLLWFLKHYSGSGANYISNAYALTFGQQRLRCNPIPSYNPIAADYEYDYASWQIAQMHAYFAEHVSDFEVAFAGNYDGAAGIDTDPVSGNIVWYDTLNPPPAAAWRSAITAAPNEFYHQTTTLPAGFLADGAWIWRHDDVGAACTWPYLLRVRYRLHDPRGRFISNDSATGFFTSGMWFESVLAVNRP